MRTLVNQWVNTTGVTKWFLSKKEKLKKPKFLIFDIIFEAFYPSISQRLLENALDYVSSLIHVTQEDKEIIMQARKSILYHNESCWGKKTGELFDVGMGSNDGAEVLEVVGLYILDLISKITEIDKDLFGLYRDDGIMIVGNANGPKIDRIRKKLHQIFNSIGLKIATLVNTDTANYLDITLDLRDMSYKPYHKPNEKLQHINIKSNHPQSIIKNLPKMIEAQLSRISSDKKKFDESKDRYEEALRASGYKYKLEYSSKAKEQKKNKRIRRRKKFGTILPITRT